MKKYRPFITGILVGVVLLVGGLLLTGGRLLTPSQNEYYQGLDKAYGKYYELIKLIDEEALADYDPQKITDKVLKRVVAGLDDPYAEYYTAEEYAQFQKKYAKSYVGIGLSVGEKDGKVVIFDVTSDAPAEEAGLEIGDVVVAVDGVEVEDVDDATNRIAGENGTEVKVTVKRDGKKKDFAMNRGKVINKSVEYKELYPKQHIGYIAISGFKQGTAKEFRLAVKDLKNSDYNKVIIDLRENGGGSTDAAYEIADMLLPECEMLSYVNAKGEKTVKKSDASTLDIKYVLLVDEFSASASEMVAGAVKDNKGGKLIGCKTYGKGVTQMTRRFKDGSALKITIEEFFRPSGKRINEVGIEPDIVMKDAHDNKAILKCAVKELKK